jgi:hypothetical protein
MQDNFNRLVRVCFYGMLILVGVLAAGAEAGSFGVPIVLGLSLFLILIAMQFSRRLMSKKPAVSGMASLGQMVAANKGGVAMLLVIMIATIVFLIKAFA